ncbi:hypothetical protein AK830_g8770 [Neonectria ditissima]|uniref:Beta-lactamase-related domain-containing protein n=1 Tax=Neonectria ditissima TaxID=78410 RepID=A0A0N8H625_9HYPO|nr:hypothetical protein AK830_g8770 [Neonectria ditissima]
MENPRMKPGKLKDTLPLIASMCKAAGVPGLAVGAIHRGEVLDQLHYGYRDVEKRLPVNSATIFYVASLTKGITATALGILVARGFLDWDTPVHEILPEMSKSSRLCEAKLNILDILSHRTGKAWADALYLQSNNKILLPKDQCIPVFDGISQVAPVRSKYMYNNHAYNIAGLVVEKVSGQKWAQFVAENIFEPLEMDRTFTKHPSEEENVAVPYNILKDGSPFRIPFCNASGDTMMFAGQSVRTSVTDLLKYSQAYLQALDEMKPSSPGQSYQAQSKERSHQGKVLRGKYILQDIFRSNNVKTTNVGRLVSPIKKKSPHRSESSSPIKEIATIVRPHVPRAVDSFLEQTYALGWNRTQLPGTLDFGWNQRVLQDFPPLGEEYPGKLAIWHGGNMPGTTAALCLLPESGTAVAVLQNSLGLCDVADWVCQLIIDVLFVGDPARDYLSLVKSCVDAGVKRMDEVARDLADRRIEGTKPRSLKSYTGRYFNAMGNWFIDVKFVHESLVFKFLGLSDERYDLRHYHYDTFVWNMSYDETVKRAQYIRPYAYYCFEFEARDTGGAIECLRWRNDPSVPGGECFYKSK